MEKKGNKDRAAEEAGLASPSLYLYENRPYELVIDSHSHNTNYLPGAS